MEHIVRRSLLYRSRVEYADFCINHVEGCAHGCKFPCYAMLLKKRCGVIKDYKEWLQPKLVSNAIELLRRELPRYKKRIQCVHLCFSTDPFMYGFPEVGEMTLQIIEELNNNRVKSAVLTKGILPPSLAHIGRFGTENEYGITLVSLDNSFKNRFEPYAAPYLDRVSSLRFLHSKGLKTWVSIEPYPTPNIIKQDLQRILGEVSFVDKIVFGKMNYNTQAGQHRGGEAFYEECTEKIIEYCQESKTELHVKHGTSKMYDAQSEVLLRNKAVKGSNLILDHRPNLFE